MASRKTAWRKIEVALDARFFESPNIFREVLAFALRIATALLLPSHFFKHRNKVHNPEAISAFNNQASTTAISS